MKPRMTARHRRGRLLFAGFAVPVLLDQGVRVGSAFAAGPGGTDLPWAAGGAAFLTAALASLWRGSNWLREDAGWLRRLTGWLCLGYGALAAAEFGLAAVRVAAPVAAGDGLRLAPPFPRAVLYAAAGLAFLTSPAVAAYLRSRAGGDRDTRDRFFALQDALNAAGAGGEPAVTERHLGDLPLRSGTLCLGDPQQPRAVTIPGVDAAAAAISARLRRYPSGREAVDALRIEFPADTPDAAPAGPPRVVGELAIDSARLVVADAADLEEHWLDTGSDRIGLVSTHPPELAPALQARFGWETVRRDPFDLEVVGPISPDLERDVRDYLKSVPEFAQFHYLNFKVHTNDSFDRLNGGGSGPRFLPVGGADGPVLFTCGTGRGDGRYEVRCTFAGETPRVVTVDFTADRG